MATALAVPAVPFAQQNDSNAATLQNNLSASLNNLNDAQKQYAAAPGMVSEMHQYGLASRMKAAQALEQIRSWVLAAGKPDKVPQDLLQSALLAIDEAQTALRTDNAQTIAWSLQTVGLEVQDVQAKLTGQKPPAETASQEHPTGTGGGSRAPDQASTARAPEQNQARVAVAAQAPAQPSQQPVSQKEPSSAANQPAPQQNALASLKRSDVVGKQLYDRSGNSVSSIKDVKTSPDGKIQAVEVDVGGFLGIGSRRVAVPAENLQVKGDGIEASMTSDEIRNLPHE